MPHLQAVVRPLVGIFKVKIADFVSRTQDHRTIATQFLFNFPIKKW